MAKSSQGDSFFVAPNPPFGAVFTYYLDQGAENREGTAQGIREKAGKGAVKTHPTRAGMRLRGEEIEEPPAIVSDRQRRRLGKSFGGLKGRSRPASTALPGICAIRCLLPGHPNRQVSSYIEIPGPLAAPGNLPGEHGAAGKRPADRPWVLTQSFDGHAHGGTRSTRRSRSKKSWPLPAQLDESATGR